MDKFLCREYEKIGETETVAKTLCHVGPTLSSLIFQHSL
jgi:hypothetical protein